ncbi:MAG: hypothetical protein LBV33_03880 [Lachnospiraceae bacterium]|jgi:hypothetical protein|nr:hypothetical protein [Lachnospiraceae bacterium]
MAKRTRESWCKMIDKNRKFTKYKWTIVLIIIVILLFAYFITSKRPHNSIDALQQELIALTESIENTLISEAEVAVFEPVESANEDSILEEEKTEMLEEQDMDFRDRNEEKEDSLERATLAQNAEEVINEDYSAKLNLADEELRLYMQKIFLDLCRNPDKIKEYEEIFSEESIGLFNEIEWQYENAGEFYDVAIGGRPRENNDGTIYGHINVDSKYAAWELELKEGAEGKWAYAVNYAYNPENGTIQIESNYLFISLY